MKKLQQIFHGYRAGDECIGAVNLYRLDVGRLEKRGIIKRTTKMVEDAVPLGGGKFGPRKVETIVFGRLK
jgi:hypothetical protein